jgi:hypothetical protein
MTDGEDESELSGASAAGSTAASPASRRRPPRRPRRRRAGSSASSASHAVSRPPTAARMAVSSVHSSGLRRCARSVSRSRSSGVRARRAIRWRSSTCRVRSRAAASAPSTRPSRLWSSRNTATGVGAGDGPALPRRGREWRSRSRGSILTGVDSLPSTAQSKLTFGWVCSSASRASSSNARRPHVTWDGERNR